MKSIVSGSILAVLLGFSCALQIAAAEDVADPRLREAEALYRGEGPEKALPEFKRLAAEFKEQKKPRDEAIAVHFIGVTNWRIGNPDEARKHLDLALAMKRDLGDRHQEAKTLNVLGLLEWELGNYEQATLKFLAASVVGRELGDKKLEGATLNNLSLVLDELGDYQTSLKQYEQVLEIYSGADFPRGEADTLGNIGRVHLQLGSYRKALHYFEQALEINEKLDLEVSMGRDYGNIALAHMGLGEIDTALNFFERAIALSDQTGMQYDLAYWLGGKGNALVQQGRYDQGLVEYRRMLTIYDTVGAHAEVVEALHDMGYLHMLLGDPSSAENYFSRAIALARELGRIRSITMNLLAMGDLEFRRERFDEAASLYRQARDQADAVGNQAYLAGSLIRLSQVSVKRQETQVALQLASRALGLSRTIAARSLQGEALYMLAEIYRLDGRGTDAIRKFNEAKAALDQIGNPELLWQIHYGRALTHEALGDKDAAVEALIVAVKIIEEVRDRLMEQRFRSGYLQDKYQVYVDLVRLQLDLGLTADAFSTAERLRARSYAAQRLRGGWPEFSNEEQRKAYALRERIRQLQRALSDEESTSQPERRQAALQTFTTELLLAQREYQTFLDDHGPGPSSETMAIPSATQIQQRLAPGEVLLEYVVGENELVVFALTYSKVLATSHSVRRDDINRRVELLRDLLRTAEDDSWRKPADALASILIAPAVNAGWLNEARHVYVVPHGILNYLPFSLLPVANTDGQRRLIDQYTLAYLPTAMALNVEMLPVTGPQNLLAMAPTNSRLRYAPEEARAINALFQPNSRLLIGDSATETRFKTLAGDFSVLHLATHGHFNKLNPMFSAVQLEPSDIDDGVLEVHEILDLDLNAELVTLSACETALGSGYFAEVPAGDEFVGLTRAFLSVGSEAVMATLWAVDDRSTVDLMKSFYERLRKPGVDNNKPAALAAAQKELRSIKKYQHPYYWAPFILVGHTGYKAVQQAKAAEANL